MNKLLRGAVLGIAGFALLTMSVVAADLTRDQLRVIGDISQQSVGDWPKLIHEHHRSMNADLVSYLGDRSTAAFTADNAHDAFFFALLADYTARELHEPIIYRLQLATAYWKKGMGTQSLDVLENVLVTDPKMVEPWIVGGGFLLQAGALEQARQKFEKALSMQHNNEEALQHIAEIYMLEKRLTEAEKADAQLLAVYPNNTKGLQIKAQLQSIQQTLTTSVSTYGSRHEPTSDARRLYVDSKSKSFAGQLPEAEAEARQAIQADPQWSDAQALLGDVLFQEAKWPDGVEAYQQAVTLQPDAEGWATLGQACQRAFTETHNHDMVDRSIQAYKEAVRLDPGNVQYQGELRRVSQL